MRVLIIRGTGGEKNNESGWFYHLALEGLSISHTMFNHRDLVRKSVVFKIAQVSDYLFRKIQSHSLRNIPFIYKRADDRLLAAVVEFKPHLVLVTQAKTITPALMDRIRRAIPDVIIVCHFQDNPFFYDPPFKTIPYYDHFFVKDTYVLNEVRKLGFKNVSYLPQACAPQVHRPVPDMTDAEREFYGSDLAFVGSMYPYRVRILEALKGYDFKIWGSGFHGDIPADSFVYSKHQRRWVVGREKSMVFTASKININTQNYQNDIFGVSSKVFQIAAAGGFQLMGYKPDLEKLFEIGSEIAVFHSRDELVELVDYYLERSEERQAMAQRARQRVLSEHTFVHRFCEIAERCGLSLSS
ncbi:MAG: hypothetical protein DRJ03_31065 [Chloroflexi bacterium]|nr:MAG: hypothetical protein DRJ03_31065 [Chloroflexota bacterium]